MAKTNGNYEVVYIIDPAQGEEAIAATVEKFKALAEKHSSVVEVEEWGKRRLMTFTSDPEFPKELDRVLGITDGILRSMIVCKDE